MWRAAFWGGIAGSAVFLGALTAIFFNIKKKIIGFIMAFGTGVLIGAASFELLTQSIQDSGIKITTVGFIAGAMVFTIFDLMIAYKGGNERKRSRENPQGFSGLAVFVGTLIDAIPESLIIGISLVGAQHVSWLLVIAIFISNFPEGLSSSIGLRKDGYTISKIIFLWFMVLVLSLFSSLAGFAFLQKSSHVVIGVIAAFAAGGIIAMVSSTMMPEAHEEGGPIVGLITAIGLLSAVILTYLE